MSETDPYPPCNATIDLGARGIHLCILHDGHTGSHVHNLFLDALLDHSAGKVRGQIRRKSLDEITQLLDALRAIILTGDDDMIDDEDARRAMYLIAQSAIDRYRASQADKEKP